MKRKTIIILVLVIIAVIFAVAIIRRVQEKQAAATGTETRARLVAVTPVALGTVRDVITATATVEPWQGADVAPEVQGTIRAVLVREGDRVRAGQVLARIDPDQPATQVQQYAASVEVARANVRALQHQLANATIDLERVKNLFAEGVETRYHLDQVQTQVNTLTAQRELALAQVRQAEALLESANVTLGRTAVLAPFAGIVTAVHQDAGNLARPGVPVVTVQQLQPVKVRISIPSRALPHVHARMPVTLVTDVWPDSPVQAAVSVIGPALDAATQAAWLEVEVPNRDNLLRAGMFASVTLVLDERDSVVVVPREAVFRFEEQDRAVVYDPATETVRWRAVTTGLQDAARLQVIDGLRPGDLLVTAGQMEVNDGERVRLAPSTPVTAADTAAAAADTAAR